MFFQPFSGPRTLPVLAAAVGDGSTGRARCYLAGPAVLGMKQDRPSLNTGGRDQSRFPGRCVTVPVGLSFARPYLERGSRRSGSALISSGKPGISRISIGCTA